MLSTITSPANPLLKDVRRAIERGSLTSEGLAVAESVHLLDEAMRSPVEIHTVLAAESAVEHLPAGIAATTLPDALFRKLSSTENTQGVMALVKLPSWTLDDLFRANPLVVVLDAIQDPGNAGTIARAAEAFGATGLILLKGSVSPFNSKTLRASAGSLFRLPFVHGLTADEIRTAFTARGIRAFAAVTGGAALANFTGPTALIIGSEAHGVSPELRAATDPVSIPTQSVESLNAALAAGILLYEARRQRHP